MNILVCLFSVCLFFVCLFAFFGIHSGPGPFFGHHTIEVRRKGYFFSYSSLDSGLGFNGFQYRYIVGSSDLCLFVWISFFFGGEEGFGGWLFSFSIWPFFFILSFDSILYWNWRKKNPLPWFWFLFWILTVWYKYMVVYKVHRSERVCMLVYQ